ncbi:MAG TPA: hypothetical protein DIC18_00705, partial [Clostridiales bacterium]|nr:hypothetical protein [Clostridiales bacterium]
YDGLKGDIERLSAAFEGDVTGNLDRIYKTLSSEAEKAQNLSHEIDRFLERSEKYERQVSSLTSTLGKLEGTLDALSKLESDAETQIGKLEATLDERRKNYNLKELERTVANYQASVTRVSDFINRDVASSLQENYDKLNVIKDGFDEIRSGIQEGNKNIDDLVSSFATTSELLRKVTDGKAVNDAYLYELLDQWAADRGIKRKK